MSMVASILPGITGASAPINASDPGSLRKKKDLKTLANNSTPTAQGNND
jgi:hypothetical protein